MPGTKLVVPMIPRADCTADRAPPVLKREATVQGGPNTANRLVVPVLLRADSVEIKKKKKKASAKQWGDFNRQAKRREKTVTLPLSTYKWLVAQPCVYCGAAGNVGVDRVRNNESYTRENSVPCCGRCNMAKRSASLRAFVQQARAIAKATRAVAQLERGSTI
jgi:hypothetical protein